MNHFNKHLQLICLMIIAAILTAAALYWLKPIMVPLVLAIMLYVGITLVDTAGGIVKPLISSVLFLLCC